MITEEEYQRRRALYQRLAAQAGIDRPELIGRGMDEFQKNELKHPDRSTLVGVSLDLRDNALDVRDGHEDVELTVHDIKVLAVIGS